MKAFKAFLAVLAAGSLVSMTDPRERRYSQEHRACPWRVGRCVGLEACL